MNDTAERVIAFSLFRYFPHGGLQRDMLRIAQACRARGYTIHIYTTSWEAEAPQGMQLFLYRPSALSNHGRMRQYHAWLARQIAANRPVCVIGFNKMPNLDVYYAADGCFKANVMEKHNWLYRLSPRYRLYQAFEEAVFGADSKTQILMISKIQEALYIQHYETDESRIHFLPPNVAKDRVAGPESDDIRRDFRRTLRIGPDEKFVLQLGSDFHRKGLDRSITAIAHLPDALLAKTRLYVVGNDKEHSYARMAKRLDIATHVVFLGARDDVPRILLGADLLLHPAYHENTGTVLLEGLVSGLPVIATGVCGYAHYIEEADAGWLIPEPFDQNRFNQTVQAALERTDLRQIGQRGILFAQEEDLYGMVDATINVIEAVALKRKT